MICHRDGKPCGCDSPCKPDVMPPTPKLVLIYPNGATETVGQVPIVGYSGQYRAAMSDANLSTLVSLAFNRNRNTATFAGRR